MLRISTNDILSVFRAGSVPAKYARHCAALRGQRHRLLTDYATLASACPGVRYQTMLLRYVIVKHLLLKYMIDFHLCTCAVNFHLCTCAAPYIDYIYSISPGICSVKWAFLNKKLIK